MPDTPDYPTLAQMEQRYDGEWVFVADPVTDDQLEVVSGTVIAHSLNRDDMHRQVREYQRTTPLSRSASLCFARIPDDLVIML